MYLRIFPNVVPPKEKSNVATAANPHVFFLFLTSCSFGFEDCFKR